MKILPALAAFSLISLSACDKFEDAIQSTSSAPSVQSKPTKDPVAELKAALDKVASAPIGEDPSGWLKTSRWEITNMDVSKTNSLTAPYKGTLGVRRRDTTDPGIYTYQISLDYDDNGWRWSSPET